RSPWITALACTISEYSRADGASRRWKTRQCESVQSIIGATDRRGEALSRDFSRGSSGLPGLSCASVARMFGWLRGFSRTGVPRLVQPREPSLRWRRGVFSPAVGATNEKGYTPHPSAAPGLDARSGDATGRAKPDRGARG